MARRIVVVLMVALACMAFAGCSSQQASGVSASSGSSPALTEDELIVQAYEETLEYSNSPEVKNFIELANKVLADDLAKMTSTGQYKTLSYYADKATEVVGELKEYDGDNARTAKFYGAVRKAGDAFEKELRLATETAKSIKVGDSDGGNANALATTDAINEFNASLNEMTSILRDIGDEYVKVKTKE